MITYVVGDLFSSPAKVLVNTVNTVGVMGKGIAYDFKRVYPEMFKQYQNYCENGMLEIGKLWLYKTPHKWILNFPTKKHWRNKSNSEYIRAGLEKFADTYDSKGIVSISFPMLGCGNGELDWDTEVQPLMNEYLGRLPIDIYVHVLPLEKHQLPEHKAIDEMRRWLREEPQALPFREFWADLMKLVRERHDFTTAVHGLQFSVIIDKDTRNLQIHHRQDVIDVGYDSLRDFWQLVRSTGFCMGDELPAGLNQYAEFVIPIISKLSYIHEVRLSRHHLVGSEDLGIQLIPETQFFSLPSYELRQSISA